MAAGTRYTGAWARKASQPTLPVPLVQETDPQHSKPDDNPGLAGSPPLWAADSSGSAPFLPPDLMAEPFATPIGGGGPIDATPYGNPEFGPGDAPGITQTESRAQMQPWHEMDLGDLAARQYNALTSRADAQPPGNGPHVAIIYDQPGDGDSPQTLQLERTGVGQPNDPYARTGKRVARWWTRFIDMHWWDVTYRPATDRYAVPQRSVAPVPDGTQLNSPFASNGPMRVTPDAFVNPQERRTPVPWDQPITTDGLSTNDAGLASVSWGL